NAGLSSIAATRRSARRLRLPLRSPLLLDGGRHSGMRSERGRKMVVRSHRELQPEALHSHRDPQAKAAARALSETAAQPTQPSGDLCGWNRAVAKQQTRARGLLEIELRQPLHLHAALCGTIKHRVKIFKRSRTRQRSQM